MDSKVDAKRRLALSHLVKPGQRYSVEEEREGIIVLSLLVRTKRLGARDRPKSSPGTGRKAESAGKRDGAGKQRRDRSPEIRPTLEPAFQ